MCFGALVFCLARGAGGWLVNGLICHVGKVSYSAYLWHFAVVGILANLAGPWTAALGLDDSRPLFIVMLLVATCITVGLSTITYTFVEKPMIAAGAVIARRWRPVTENALIDVKCKRWSTT